MKKLQLLKLLKKISIRGRVAFFTVYLENVILNKYGSLEKWEIILSHIWSYTSEVYLDEWHERFIEFLPESILEKLPFEEKGFEVIDFRQYSTLYDLYKDTEEEILYLIQNIFYIGTIELYGKIEKQGVQSLSIINDMLEMVDKNKEKLPALPQIDKFEKFYFELRNGWGVEFDKTEI